MNRNPIFSIAYTDICNFMVCIFLRNITSYILCVVIFVCYIYKIRSLKHFRDAFLFTQILCNFIIYIKTPSEYFGFQITMSILSRIARSKAHIKRYRFTIRHNNNSPRMVIGTIAPMWHEIHCSRHTQIS